jgi:hypothetical protein
MMMPARRQAPDITAHALCVFQKDWCSDAKIICSQGPTPAENALPTFNPLHFGSLDRLDTLC